MVLKKRQNKKRISKCNNYRIGRQFEYRVKKYYEKLGYFVIRSYASKGAADLYCMKPTGYLDDPKTTELLLIQCKNYKAKLPEIEQDNLRDLAPQTGGVPIHVFKDKQRKLNFVTI